MLCGSLESTVDDFKRSECRNHIVEAYLLGLFAMACDALCTAKSDLTVNPYEESPCDDLEIGYHKIRGLAAPLRMMCYYTGTSFKHVYYGNDMKDTWHSGAKLELSKINAAVNLPYIKNNGEIVTQTNTCLLYLGRILAIDKKKFEMYNHLVLDQVYDWRNDLMMNVYPPGIICGSVTKEEWPEAGPKHLTGATKTHLTKLEGLCRGSFMCGNSPQSGDFHLFEMLDQHKKLAESFCMPDPLAGFPKMQRIHTAFKNSRQLAKYFGSEHYLNYSHNNPLVTNFTGLAPGYEYGPSGEETVDC